MIIITKLIVHVILGIIVSAFCISNFIIIPIIEIFIGNYWFYDSYAIIIIMSGIIITLIITYLFVWIPFYNWKRIKKETYENGHIQTMPKETKLM